MLVISRKRFGEENLNVSVNQLIGFKVVVIFTKRVDDQLSHLQSRYGTLKALQAFRACRGNVLYQVKNACFTAQGLRVKH